MQSNESTINSKSEQTKIDGWLIIFGITFILKSVGLLFLSYVKFSTIFQANFKNALISNTSKYYLYSEAFGTLLFLIFSILVLIFFFKKSKSFLKVWVTFFIAYLLYISIILVIMLQIPLFAELKLLTSTKKLLSQNLFYFIIWGTYLLKSKRVKRTFIK